jgi:hypothetical protein
MALFEEFGPESSVPAPQLPGRASLDASALDPNSDCYLAQYTLCGVLGHGSFGRVSILACFAESDHKCAKDSCFLCGRMRASVIADLRKSRKALRNSLLPSFYVLQVRLAEHVSTKHRVAIKIMDRKLLQQKDLDGKGATPQRLVS